MEVKIVGRQLKKLETEFVLTPYRTAKRQELTVGNITLYFRLEGDEEHFRLDVMVLDRLKSSSSDVIHACRISSNKLNINQKRYIGDESDWRILTEQEHDMFSSYEFDLTLESETVLIRKPFAVLYDDEATTDFELCAEDGSVRFHSTVLATASPALRRMLSGPWSETETRSLGVRDTTKTTLQHLKDYLYLYKLPESGVEQLLLLASYYMMSELENQCIEKLLTEVTTENCAELSRFALNNNMTKLFNSFLLMVKDGIIDVANLQEKELKPDSMVE